MFRNPLMLCSLFLTVLVAGWGIFDTAGLASFAAGQVKVVLRSRGWFVMLTASAMLLAAFWLAISPYGRIRLGAEDEAPEFSTGGDENPPVRVKLTWGIILGLLGLAMILSDSVAAVREIIAMSAGPFVFIVLLLMVCLLKALKREKARTSP